MRKKCRKSCRFCSEEDDYDYNLEKNTHPRDFYETLVLDSQDYSVPPKANRAVAFPSADPTMFHWVNKTTTLGERRQLIFFWSTNGFSFANGPKYQYAHTE